MDDEGEGRKKDAKGKMDNIAKYAATEIVVKLIFDGQNLR